MDSPEPRSPKPAAAPRRHLPRNTQPTPLILRLVLANALCLYLSCVHFPGTFLSMLYVTQYIFIIAMWVLVVDPESGEQSIRDNLKSSAFVVGTGGAFVALLGTPVFVALFWDSVLELFSIG